ncbi:MAG: hypothetical protein FWG85_01945 [Bacteroidetes bacterium]|nr:hypothetical protein [Bacteroidota bacterium]
MKKIIYLIYILIATPIANAQFLGDGTETNPYQIRNKTELEYLADSVNSSAPSPADNWSKDKYFILINDITAPVTQKIGTTISISFQGNFDGNNKTIRLDMNYPGESYVGLFGSVDRGTIKNVIIRNTSNVRGNYYVGGICGYACKYSAISNCINNGEVQGNYYVGGICGEINSGTTISNSINNAKVKGNEGVGGISGFIFESTIANCMNVESIEGNNIVAGIGGFVYGILTSSTIINCSNYGYIKGIVGTAAGIIGYDNDYSAITNSINTGVVEGGGGTGGILGE